jgi:hypothetical protein
MQSVSPFQVPDPSDPTHQIPACLLDIAPASALHLVGPPPIQNSNTGSTLSLGSALLDLNAAARLGYGDMFSVAASANAQLYLQEILILLAPQANSLGGAIAQEYYGFGVRMLIMAYGVTASATANIASIAASCEVNNSASSYSIEFLGIPIALQNQLGLLFAQSMGKFNMEVATSVVGSLQSILQGILDDPAQLAQITPALLYVDVDLTKVPVVPTDLCTYFWTMWQLHGGTTLANALTAASKIELNTSIVPAGTIIDPDQVQGYYAHYGLGQTSPVPASVMYAAAANTFLKLG